MWKLTEAPCASLLKVWRETPGPSAAAVTHSRAGDVKSAGDRAIALVAAARPDRPAPRASRCCRRFIGEVLQDDAP
jgi:hypothetical protein